MKLDNVLIDHEGTAKIADFGLIRMLDGKKESDKDLTKKTYKMTGQTGSDKYMAPGKLGRAMTRRYLAC